MTTISAEEARNQFAELLNRAAYGHERTIVTRRGKRLAAIVSIEDLDLLEAILDEIEDRSDAEYCRKALKDIDLSQTVPWEDLKSELGLE
jgi:prevent-host-death family protein